MKYEIEIYLLFPSCKLDIYQDALNSQLPAQTSFSAMQKNKRRLAQYQLHGQSQICVLFTKITISYIKGIPILPPHHIQDTHLFNQHQGTGLILVFSFSSSIVWELHVPGTISEPCLCRLQDSHQEVRQCSTAGSIEKAGLTTSTRTNGVYSAAGWTYEWLH